MAGAADPLQPARDRLRRLDLDHEVDGAHVDPELERRGRDQARQLAGLQHLLDDQPLLARERAVVRARAISLARRSSFSRSASRSAPRRLLTNMIVERCALDQLEQLGVDRGPDRAARRLAAAGERVEVGRRRRVGLDHRLDRHVDLEVELLAHAGVDDPARRASGRP